MYTSGRRELRNEAMSTTTTVQMHHALTGLIPEPMKSLRTDPPMCTAIHRPLLPGEAVIGYS